MKHKYTTTFSSILKPLVSEEKDKYLALASLVEIGNFIPNVDTEKNIDLLPVAFNAAVVNRVNKNGDVIDSKTAIAMYENFINKPINLEHNRERIFGVIIHSSPLRCCANIRLNLCNRFNKFIAKIINRCD